MHRIDQNDASKKRRSFIWLLKDAIYLCFFPECKVTRGGHEYGGKISRTRSGRTCQRWDTTVPHLHDYSQSACQFPDDTVSDAANYCRNPDSDEHGGPWCFTTDPDTRWEYCDIPMCGRLIDEKVISKDLHADDVPR